jgi:hypothetical protein
VRRALVVGFVAVATLLSVGVVPARAANDTTTSAAPQLPRGHITLVQQPAWSALGSDVTLRVRIDGDVGRLGVSTAFHSMLSSRTAFTDTIGKDGLGGRARFNSAPVTSLAVVGDVYTVSGLVHVPSSGEGVYPLEIELYDLRTHDRVDGFVTYVVAVPSTQPGEHAIAEPLALAWIWPVVANPAYLPDGAPDPAVVAQLGATGRLGRIASLVRTAAGLPITVAPGPETLESWSALAGGNKDLAATFASLRDSMRTFLAGTYVPVDVPALVAGGLPSEVGSQLATGAETLTSALGVRADARTVAVDPVDQRGLNQLRQSGVDRVVVDPSRLTPVASKLTPARPFQIDTDGRSLTAVATDPGLAALLDPNGASPALRAQRFLAGLAVVAFEAPGQERGVVVEMPGNWNVDAATQTAVTTVLEALRANPLVKVDGVGNLLDNVPLERSARSRREALVRTTQSLRPASLPVSAHDVRAASDRLDAFRALVAPDDPRVRRGNRALLVSVSSVWSGASGHRRAQRELGVIDDAINAYVAQIRGPVHPTVTITARRAAIPISFQNTGNETVKVRVRLVSEKLVFPDGADRVLTLPPHNTTARFAVETQVSGTFPLTVSVTSPDGRIVFEQTRFTVRSTVVSGVGLVLMLGAGFFLAGWWANHYRRRRRGRREARESGSAPAARGPAAWRPTAPSRGSAG